MKKSTFLFLLVFIISIFISACGPSANPILQKKIADFSTKSSGNSFSDKGKFIKPMALSVGQWVMYYSQSKDSKSISKTSIVGKEGDGWIIENYSLNESEEATSQICISGMEKIATSGNMDDIEILWVKILKDGKVQTIDGPVLSLTKSFYKKGLSNLGLNTSVSTNGGSVTVPAGTFANTIKVKSETSFLGSTYTSEGYLHPDVPINGLVKSVSSEENFSMVLVDFGKTGAQKSF
jgi:hypothetical protein